MRVTFFLFVFYLLFGVFLWVTLSDALFFVGLVFYLIFLAITVSYSDTMILFLLGAREVRSSDEPLFFKAASQGSYKLAVPMPKLYFYNGILERGFILQSRGVSSLILSKSLLESSRPDELSAICFELLLQVKRGMASKRTKVMFFLGAQSWLAHGITNLMLSLVPIQSLKESANWLLSYLLHPWLNMMFKFTLGRKYFTKLQIYLKEFPDEDESFAKVGLKLSRPDQLYSFPTRKLIELSSFNRSRHFQNILALEFLPHEWDYLFSQGTVRVE